MFKSLNECFLFQTSIQQPGSRRSVDLVSGQTFFSHYDISRTEQEMLPGICGESLNKLAGVGRNADTRMFFISLIFCLVIS